MWWQIKYGMCDSRDYDVDGTTIINRILLILMGACDWVQLISVIKREGFLEDNLWGY